MATELTEEYLVAARRSMDAYKERNPFDRFSKPVGFIIGLIAADFARNGINDSRARSIINSYVIVGGKGWTSY